VLRFIGKTSPRQGFTLRKLLKSLCREMAVGFRREVAGIVVNLEQQVTDQRNALSELQAQAEAEAAGMLGCLGVGMLGLAWPL